MAETSSAVQKCMTVGVLNVAMPSWRAGEAYSSPRTKVITTNINPVSAAADEPAIT